MKISLFGLNAVFLEKFMVSDLALEEQFYRREVIGAMPILLLLIMVYFI